MTDKNRTRNVQKEALYEVLRESVKDKQLDNQYLSVLQQLANDIEDQVFLVSNQDINKDYRQRINAIKVRLKGEKGALLRTALIDRLLNPQQLMQMNINQLNEEHIIDQLVKQGINLTKNQILQNSQIHSAPQKNPRHSTEQKSQQKSEEQINQYEGISEIKEKYDQIDEQTPTQFNNQFGELLESQAQIKLLLEELDNKPKLEMQQEKKDDDIEQYEPILNTQINQEVNSDKNEQNQDDQQFLDQVAEKLIQDQQQEPLPSDDKVNQDIIQDDIDVSQSKLCASLLKNIEEKTEQEQLDNEFLSRLYKEINQLRLKNRELIISNEFHQQEQKRMQLQFKKELEKQQLFFQTEIQQLKAQLELAKHTKKYAENNNLIMKSFSERQEILKNIVSNFSQQRLMQNEESHYQNRATVQKENQAQELKNEVFYKEKDQQKVVNLLQQETEFKKSKIQEQPIEGTSSNNEQQKQNKSETIITPVQTLRKHIPPPLPQQSKSNQSQQQKAQNLHSELNSERRKEKQSVQNSEQQQEAIPLEDLQQAENFFNQLSQQHVPNTQIKVEHQKGVGKNQEQSLQQQIISDPREEIFFSTTVQNESHQPSQDKHYDGPYKNDGGETTSQEQQMVFSSNPFENQQHISSKLHRPVAKQRRVNAGSVQNVPSSLFD